MPTLGPRKSARRVHPALVSAAALILLLGAIPPVPAGQAASWEGTWVVAHRGSMDGAPENTLPALRVAAARGADAAEIDVSLTEDGVAVLLHDLWLERTTDGEGGIFETPWDVVSGLRSDGVPVPRLSEALEEAEALGLPLWLDLKGLKERRALLLEVVVSEVLEAGAQDRVWLLETPCPEGLRCIGNGVGSMDEGVEGVLLRPSAATPDVLERAHDRGVRVALLGLPADGRVPLGVDAVMVDDVLAARQALGQLA